MVATTSNFQQGSAHRVTQRRGTVTPAPLPTAENCPVQLCHVGVARAPLGGWTIVRPVDATRSTLRLYDARRWATAEEAQAALDAELAPPPVLRRVCAWCQRDMGVVVCEPKMAGQVTHGICPTCAEKQLAELRALTTEGGA